MRSEALENIVTMLRAQAAVSLRITGAAARVLAEGVLRQRPDRLGRHIDLVHHERPAREVERHLHERFVERRFDDRVLAILDAPRRDQLVQGRKLALGQELAELGQIAVALDETWARADTRGSRRIRATWARLRRPAETWGRAPRAPRRCRGSRGGRRPSPPGPSSTPASPGRAPSSARSARGRRAS